MEEKYELIWDNIKNNIGQIIELLEETTGIDQELQMEYHRIDILELKFKEKVKQFKLYCDSPFSNLLKMKVCALLLSMIKQNEKLIQKNAKSSQTFAYNKKSSLLNGLKNEYMPTIEEWQKLYVFYVAYSMGAHQSCQGKNYLDYGWKATTLNSSGVKNELEKILKLSDLNFKFLEKGEDLKENFENLRLLYPILDFEIERGVFAKTPGSSKYDKFFYRVRNCFAHGGFFFVFNKLGEVMVILEDHSPDNVSARIIIKLETLLKVVNCIDKKCILSSGEKIQEKVLVRS